MDSAVVGKTGKAKPILPQLSIRILQHRKGRTVEGFELLAKWDEVWRGNDSECFLPFNAEHVALFLKTLEDVLADLS